MLVLASFRRLTWPLVAGAVALACGTSSDLTGTQPASGGGTTGLGGKSNAGMGAVAASNNPPGCPVTPPANQSTCSSGNEACGYGNQECVCAPTTFQWFCRYSASAAGGTGAGGATSGDGGAAGYDAWDGTAGAAPCWGDARDQLPQCAMADACFPDTAFAQCVQTGDCTFRFSRPITFHADLFVNCALVANDSWTFASDQQTLSLTGPACDQARASGMPRIVVQLAHPCIIID